MSYGKDTLLILCKIIKSRNSIKSLNFSDKIWLVTDKAGNVVDPYKQLEPVFKDVDQKKLDRFLSNGDELADGGAAMTAWARMQFTEMSYEERKALADALLRYCELDTLAMVMLYEYLAYEICGLRAAA